MATKYRGIPSVEKILSHPKVKSLSNIYSHDVLVSIIRESLSRIREDIQDSKDVPNLATIADGISTRISHLSQQIPTPVINGTGVVIHTNLGRIPLSEDAVLAISSAAQNYTTLEFDIENNSRGSRNSHIEPILTQLSGSEAALVLNNNASALMVSLAAISKGKDVIVSRGEAVEIGGGFRIPDIISNSGASNLEIGTTNRTYIEDYENAITDKTGAILKVHTSNFKVSGFVHEPPLSELVGLAANKGIPLLHDIGSGCMIDTTQFGLAHEPMIQTSVEAGSDLVLFSGDKLLGGPQSGIIIGKKNLITTISRHPTARAARIDKLSLAGLKSTLIHYIQNEALTRIPVWSMISMTLDEIKARVTLWNKLLDDKCALTNGLSAIGGGSLPGETLPTILLSLDNKLTGGADRYARTLLEAPIPIASRIEEDRVMIDPRTVLPKQDSHMIVILRQTLKM